MVDTQTMLVHSNEVKKRIAEARKSKGKRAPLISNIGKYWVVNAQTSRRQKSREDKTADAGINYGWHRAAKGVYAKTATLQPNVDIWQQPGSEHPLSHSDYSQLIVMVSRSVRVCEPAALSGFGAIGYNCKDGSNCKIKGVPGKTRCVDIYDLAQDPKLAKIVSHEGTINMRIPSVPYQAPTECAVQALAGPNPDWIEYEDDPDEKEFPISGLGESPYVMFGANGFGDALCGKKPQAPTTIGAGAPPPGKAPTSSPPRRGPLDKIAFGPWILAASVGVTGLIGLSLYLQAKDKQRSA
ncbi:MAG: hypothetical protein EBT03_12165 [Betaproteobacteria bacterium]|nr:hypothetical protein [Betaproteobacteria bacterium]